MNACTHDIPSSHTQLEKTREKWWLPSNCAHEETDAVLPPGIQALMGEERGGVRLECYSEEMNESQNQKPYHLTVPIRMWIESCLPTFGVDSCSWWIPTILKLGTSDESTAAIQRAGQSQITYHNHLSQMGGREHWTHAWCSMNSCFCFAWGRTLWWSVEPYLSALQERQLVDQPVHW